MNKLILIIIISIAGYSVKSQIITVDNKPLSAANYSDLQTAIDAANPGDTLFVSGSDISYGNINIQKRLILIGPGFSPANQFQETASIGRIDLDITGTTDPSGTVLSGFELSSVYVNWGINELIITRNRVSVISVGGGSQTSVNSWLITNNIIRSSINLSDYSSTTYSTNDIIISNNIFSGTGVNGIGSPVIVSNNLFITGTNYFLYNALSNCEKGLFVNNIIYGMQYASTSVNRMVANNNISFNSTGTDFDVERSTTANNLENIDPLFTNENGDLTFSYDEEYSLSASSPGKNYGTDGTDVGIYGGAFPWPADLPTGFKYTPFPKVPQILELNIENSAIPENGALNVNFKAKISN